MKQLITGLYGFYLNTLALAAPNLAARKGFLLFCRPFRGRLTDRQREFFNAAEKFNFHHDGHDLQAYRWGNGPKKVLFLHGWQSHTYRWKAYVDALSRDEYTMYAFDAPGHGLTGGNFLSVPLYSTLIDAFVREHGAMDAVVAHSIGAFSLLYTLYTFPALPVNRAVVMGAPGEATEFVDVFRKTLNLTDRTVGCVIDHFVKTYDVSPEHFSVARFAPQIQNEGLIIHDEGDAEAPYHYAVRLKESWKNSRLITTKDLGHNLRSPQVVQHVAEFIGAASTDPVSLTGHVVSGRS